MRGRGLAGREARPAGSVPSGAGLTIGAEGRFGAAGQSHGQRCVQPVAAGMGTQGCCAKLIPQGIAFLRTAARLAATHTCGLSSSSLTVKPPHLG